MKKFLFVLALSVFYSYSNAQEQLEGSDFEEFEVDEYYGYYIWGHSWEEDGIYKFDGFSGGDNAIPSEDAHTGNYSFEFKVPAELDLSTCGGHWYNPSLSYYPRYLTFYYKVVEKQVVPGYYNQLKVRYKVEHPNSDSMTGIDIPNIDLSED